MITIKTKDISQKDNYKLLIGSIVPRPIAFVTSQSKNGIINGAPFSYFNIVSSNPPMISVSIERKKGMIKDTAGNIRDNGEFVAHIVSKEHLKKINETAAYLPHDESEIELADLSLANSHVISTPGIIESKVRFECQLERIIELGDDHDTNTDLIIGKIVCYHIDESIYDNGKIKIRTLQAISRLAGADYAEIGDIHTIERPK